MIFNYFLLELLLFKYECADKQPPIKLIPKSSATVLNQQLVTNNPDSGLNETKLHTCDIYSGDVRFLGASRFSKFDEKKEDYQYNFEFLNAPGSIRSKDKVYVIKSLQFKHRSIADASLAKRFSLLKLNEWRYIKSSYSNMTEPSFDHFPHFDYSSTLVGTMDENYSLLNTSLYILGGAKYFPSTKTTKIIRSFCRYNFQLNQWEDLTHLLPLNDFKPFAGHQVINVENKKLIVLGGYRTTTYNSDYSIPYNESELIDFQTIWIFDILNHKWERQTTYYESDDQHLQKRKHYAFPVTYRNNNIYMIRDEYSNNEKYDKDFIFGVLDLTNWHWRWKRMKSSQSIYADLSMVKDTLLIENYMLVFHQTKNSGSSDTIQVIGLDQEELVDRVQFPLSIISGEKYLYENTWNGRLLTVLKFIAIYLSLPVFFVLILLIIYKLKQRKKNQFRAINDESEMVDIWSDEVPLIQINLNSFQSKSNTLQNKDTTNMMNLPHFQNEIDTRFEDRELFIPNILNEIESPNHNKSNFNQ